MKIYITRDKFGALSVFNHKLYSESKPMEVELVIKK